MDSIERRSDQIPSIRISPDLLAEIARLVYETSTKILKDSSLLVQVVEPKRIRSYTSVDEVRSLKLPARINGIGIDVGDQHGDPDAEFSASLDFGFLEPLVSKYEFFGPEEQNMNGLEATLKDRWKEHHTWNFLAHKHPWQSIILTLAVLGILLGIARVLTRLGWLSFQTGGASGYLALSFIGVMIFPMSWAPLKKFIKWMFPYFSYTEDASSRKRKWVRWGVGIAVTSLSLSDIIARILVG